MPVGGLAVSGLAGRLSVPRLPGCLSWWLLPWLSVAGLPRGLPWRLLARLTRGLPWRLPISRLTRGLPWRLLARWAGRWLVRLSVVARIIGSGFLRALVLAHGPIPRGDRAVLIVGPMLATCASRSSAALDVG